MKDDCQTWTSISVSNGVKYIYIYYCCSTQIDNLNRRSAFSNARIHVEGRSPSFPHGIIQLSFYARSGERQAGVSETHGLCIVCLRHSPRYNVLEINEVRMDCLRGPTLLPTDSVALFSVPRYDVLEINKVRMDYVRGRTWLPTDDLIPHSTTLPAQAPLLFLL
jgi:hypothetical protein